jgi:hypothetical protein
MQSKVSNIGRLGLETENAGRRLDAIVQRPRITDQSPQFRTTMVGLYHRNLIVRRDWYFWMTEFVTGIRDRTGLTLRKFERQGEVVFGRKGQFRLVTNFQTSWGEALVLH